MSYRFSHAELHLHRFSKQRWLGYFSFTIFGKYSLQCSWFLINLTKSEDLISSMLIYLQFAYLRFLVPIKSVINSALEILANYFFLKDANNEFHWAFFKCRKIKFAICTYHLVTFLFRSAFRTQIQQVDFISLLHLKK